MAWRIFRPALLEAGHKLLCLRFTDTQYDRSQSMHSAVHDHSQYDFDQVSFLQVLVQVCGGASIVQY